MTYRAKFWHDVHHFCAALANALWETLPLIRQTAHVRANECE